MFPKFLKNFIDLSFVLNWSDLISAIVLFIPALTKAAKNVGCRLMIFVKRR